MKLFQLFALAFLLISPAIWARIPRFLLANGETNFRIISAIQLRSWKPIYASTPYAYCIMIRRITALPDNQDSGLSDIGINCIAYNTRQRPWWLLIRRQISTWSWIIHHQYFGYYKRPFSEKPSQYLLHRQFCLPAMRFRDSRLDLVKQEIKETYYIGNGGAGEGDDLVRIITTLFGPVRKRYLKAWYKIQSRYVWKKDSGWIPRWCTIP